MGVFSIIFCRAYSIGRYTRCTTYSQFLPPRLNTICQKFRRVYRKFFNLNKGKKNAGTQTFASFSLEKKRRSYTKRGIRREDKFLFGTSAFSCGYIHTSEVQSFVYFRDDNSAVTTRIHTYTNTQTHDSVIKVNKRAFHNARV